MGTGEAAHYRAGQRTLPDRYGRKEVSRWDFVHLGKSPWPSTSDARPSYQEAARQNCTLHVARTRQPTSDSARTSLDSNRTQRPEAGVLLRQWIDSSRNRAQNGGAVLAAASSRSRFKKFLSPSKDGLPWRYHRGCECRQHRGLP